MNSFYASYRRHRFPAGIISDCVRLYLRFSLSLRDIVETTAWTFAASWWTSPIAPG